MISQEGEEHWGNHMGKSELPCKEGRDLPPSVYAFGSSAEHLCDNIHSSSTSGHGTNIVIFCMFQVFGIIKKYIWNEFLQRERQHLSY